MPKLRTLFFCTECGNETPRWQGQCPACGAWNTLAEAPHEPSPRSPVTGTIWSGDRAVRLADVDPGAALRYSTGIGEFDFVVGGGLVPGALLLVGGEPGIGKSTLLLQLAARLETQGTATLYASAEESATQVRMRAQRLGADALRVPFFGGTSLDAILAESRTRSPRLLIIDSVQTIQSAGAEQAAGSIAQLRECATIVQRFAKQSGTTVVLVGHVTKDGSVAGPRTLEHIVDTVLYFEGAPGMDHRVLRATKNRFGSADEIGMFRMTPEGLAPVDNPSAIFLAERRERISGSAVTVVIEGTRPLLIEVQALCSRASYGAAQRVATGFDRQRLALLLAVLEKRAGIPSGQYDVFVNIAGGARLVEPAGDLAVVVALASSVADRAIPARTVFLGEVGLGGEIRSVGQLERRLAEAGRSGFDTAYVPERVRRPAGGGVRTLEVADLSGLLADLFSWTSAPQP
ncbi:MAG: DNA repair protein RadA [Gemmatimonadetes bacterium]|nr:DNA repair protein RadA [Gemmatimonadota bacterium]